MELVGVAGEIVFVALSFIAREDPNMRVFNLVADYFRQDPFGAEGLSLRLGDLLHHFKIISSVLYIPDPADVLFRYDLRVARRMRMDVQKGEE